MKIAFIASLVLVQTTMAADLIFKCKNHEQNEVLELVIGEQKNHLMMTAEDAPLHKGESATWASKGLKNFTIKDLPTSVRPITMTMEITGNDTVKLMTGFYMDPGCPSCESRNYANSDFECKLAKKGVVDHSKYFEYKREAHYPTGRDFQEAMREVTEDFWSPRSQVTLVDTKTKEFLIINFDNGRIWFHGTNENSGGNDFMKAYIVEFLKKKPLYLEEATNQAGKCQLESLMKNQYPNKQCDKFLKDL